MRTLKEAIEALRREMPLGCHGAAATLQCVALEKGGSLTFGVLTSSDIHTGATHSVTVQIGGGPTQLEPSAVVETQAPANILSHLSQMFGPPGFDNAARASVFWEIFDDLAPAQVQALLENLRADRTEVPLKRHSDTAVAMARARLLRLLKLGPSGLSGGIDAMLHVFEQGSVAEVLEMTRSHWKSQADWIDTTPPGVRLQ